MREKEREEEEDRERNCFFVSVSACESEKEADLAGSPHKMTSEFHPLSQIQKSAVTTKTGCQGDPLYLSIKGTSCEDYSDLKNKQSV